MLHEKSMLLHPAALHRKTMKEIRALLLEKILRLAVKIPVLPLTVKIKVYC